MLWRDNTRVPSFVVILEDDLSRVRAMRPIITELLPSTELLVFDNAPDAIAFLNCYREQTVLISLDHDLGPSRTRDDQAFDPGNGRDVASFLSCCNAAFPAIVHSANYEMAYIMVEMLRESGWAASIVTPYSQLALGWITAEWRAEIEWLIGNGKIKTSHAEVE